ncbi:hypothetical protein [Aquimarina brevivitae]|uniref:Outer membrane protein with beta-barrel domain n=1 Tax=Aquimarina brevivitae TaxID=323412 RepID=A0A4Q7P1V3_9FLAO|nr:hypothetical protein [Aquimarina brevivitae]RZS93557.1 hypothetical protein EV197_2137 [Aquimarina brevivitae]
MKKTVLTILVIGNVFLGSAQQESVEKSIFGLQIGTLGSWLHHEAKLTNQIAIRSEFGLDTGIFRNSFYDKNGVFFAPVITIEPRWYYNLAKRANKAKRIDGNSGNFFGIKISYHPDWFTISNEDNINLISDLSVIPTWGIRRNIGKHFNYEIGFGLGYIRYFEKDNVILNDKNDVVANLHLRLGYKF